MEVDRISGLPEEIIHNILSFLPTKDVHKTSVLSKAFFSSWSSFPVIALDYDEFMSSKTRNYSEGFADFLNRSIQRWKVRETSLQNFELSYHYCVYEIDDAICFAIRNGVKVLNLAAFGYSLPLITDSSNSIKTLKFIGLDLKCLHHLLAASPVIETLWMELCSHLKCFKLSSTTIRSIKLKNPYYLEVIEIESPSLQEMSISNVSSSINEINIYRCTSLKVLYLDSSCIKDKWVDQTIPQLVQLRDLKFSTCSELKNLRICSGSLKSVELVRCDHLQCVEIVGDSVECLNFVGNSYCDIKFNAPKLMSLPTNTNSDITVSISTKGPLHDNFFAPLRYSIQEVFKNRRYCDIICNSDKDWIIPEKIRGNVVAPVPGRKHLTVWGFQRIYVEVVDSLLWLFPQAETILFRSHNDYEQLIRIANTTDPNTRRKIKRMNKNSVLHKADGTVKHDDLLCRFCTGFEMCWRHSANTILLEKFDTSDRETLMKYFAQKGKVIWWVNKW